MENEELKKLEEALSRLIESHLERASRLHKATTGVGCDGFHAKCPLDLTKETRIEVVEFLEKMEQSGKWPQQACTTMFFVDQKNITSERPVVLVLKKAPEVANWHQRHRIEWDAIDGRNGGAQRTVWEMLMEMESCKYRAGEEDLGAVAVVLDLDLAKGFERVGLPMVWAWGTHFNFF